MFHSSSHRKHWIFPNLEEVDKLRQKRIENFAAKYAVVTNDLVTLEEQKILCEYHEQKLFKLCLKFQPPLPYSVIFTAFVYYKRMYLQTSIMENSPEEMISVSLYMACKVEEYNVSVDKFVLMYPAEEQLNVTNVILSNEMNLMSLLNYHLVIHSPKRAMEGFFIDIKTRCPQGGDLEMHRETAIEFLNAVLFTDIVFLYPPSQIALAALHKASIEVIHKYILSVLAPGEKGRNILEKVNDITRLVGEKQACKNDCVKLIAEKLSRASRLFKKGKVKKRKTVQGLEIEETPKRQKASSLDEIKEMNVDVME